MLSRAKNTFIVKPVRQKYIYSQVIKVKRTEPLYPFFGKLVRKSSREKSSRKYYYYWKPIGGLSETHQRPTCLIGDPSETSTCFIRDPSETDMPQYIIPIFIKRRLFKCFETPIGLSRHVGLRWVFDQACQSPMGHRCVSNRSLIIIIFSRNRKLKDGTKI